MRILADQNIPFVTEAFAAFGEVSLFVGRELTHAQVMQADVLLVRSVTRVNAALLENTPVKFVATATIGTDHIDLDYLAKHQIGFASAPGSNATSASEYVLAALLHYAKQQNIDLTSKTVGIVGYGNVGSRVGRLLRALGMTLKIYDPPRAEQYSDVEYCTWQDILACDVVTAHVPLTRTGDCPTYQMFNSKFFSALKPGALFINTARGKAVDETALHAQLAQQKPLHLILDVWCNEPAIDKSLLENTILGTAHIAGYAYDGKLRGTEMIYLAACKFFHKATDWSVQQVLKENATVIDVDSDKNFQTQLYDVVKQVYDIQADDAALRQIFSLDEHDSAVHFDRLRKHYPRRREFPHYTLMGDRLSEVFEQLGFLLAIKYCE